MPNRTRSYLLIATLSIAATLLATLCAYVYSATFFPPVFRGWTEVGGRGEIAGWVVNKRAPTERVEVQLYVDDQFIGYRVANLPRPDVVAAGRAVDERCGYAFDVPPLAKGEHVGRAFALHKVGAGKYLTLQLIGVPVRFTVDEAGKVSAVGRTE